MEIRLLAAYPYSYSYSYSTAAAPIPGRKKTRQIIELCIFMIWNKPRRALFHPR